MGSAARQISEHGNVQTAMLLLGTDDSRNIIKTGFRPPQSGTVMRWTIGLRDRLKLADAGIR